jgi:polyisoprenoid-binding protein YceI
MTKYMAISAVAVILALAVLGLDVSTKSASRAGSWQVDTRHSDAQLVTDGTTDYGKTKLDFTLGFGRVYGRLNIDDADPAKSNVILAFYPATSMSPAIAEDGKFLSQWLADQANRTLVCFHSKTVQRTADGRLQATGELAVTRVDRNVQLDPTEAYSGPLYGPPIVHRVSREATFVFDLPSDGSGQKDGAIQASASTNAGRQEFPQLLRTVISTYWPPVVQDEKCQMSDASEAYKGAQCTGTVLETSGLPEVPGGRSVGEDYPGPPSNFSAVVGNHLTILVHMHLMAKTSGKQKAGAE